MPAHSSGSLLPAFALAAALALYLGAATRQRSSRRGWSRWRTATFVAGLLMLLLALSPPAAAFAHHDLRGHMLQHIAVGMIAPIALVLGAPLTLALRTLPLPAARSLSVVLRSPAFHALSHPLTALLLNSGGMALLYLTPLYYLAQANQALHSLVLLHFLLAGYLFAWVIAGPDPAPRRPGMGVRLGVLFLSAAAHAILSKLLYIQLLPAGAAHSADDIGAAAQLMYYGGDVAELLLAVALFAGWYQRSGRRQTRRALVRAASISPLAVEN